MSILYFIRFISNQGWYDEGWMMISSITHFRVTIFDKIIEKVKVYPVPLSMTTTLSSILLHFLVFNVLKFKDIIIK